MAPEVAAALVAGVISAAVGSVGLIFSSRTRRSDLANRAAERTQDVENRRVERAQDIGVRRRQLADEQRRATYVEFLRSAEEAIDRLQRLVDIGVLSRYRSGVATRRDVAGTAPPGFELGPEPVNPMPMLAGTAEEQVLNELAIHARTARVMVEIVGPAAVAQAALAYERSLDAATCHLIDRNPDAVDRFNEAAGQREAFVEAARHALDPEAAWSEDITV